MSMDMTRNLLVELFVEELPPKALKTLGEAFAEGIAEGLARRQLRGAHRDWTAFASPRRLAVHVPGSPRRQRTGSNASS